jgi:transcriptional regulator with XRE-family HTH domain
LLAIVAYPDATMAAREELRDELEHRWRDLGEFIREQRRITHLSLRKLSEMAGISNPYLSQIERGMRKPSADILQQIARALEISAETLYVRAGILDEKPSEGDLASEIRRDPHLTEEQKTALLRIYWSFRHENGDLVQSAAGPVASAPTPAPTTPPPSADAG